MHYFHVLSPMLFAFVACLIALPATVAQPDLPKPPAESEKPPIQQIGAELFQIGEVRLDKEKKTVSFPGKVNMDKMLIEYAVVGDGGKLHESLLVTPVEPYHVHLAVLLLGATNQSMKVESGLPLSGSPVMIWVEWKHEGVDRKVRIEELIRKEQGNEVMEKGAWLYNGSKVVNGVFQAQVDRSIASIIEDVNSLVNYPRKGRENDEIWHPNEKLIPPVNTPVRIIFSFEPLSVELLN